MIWACALRIGRAQKYGYNLYDHNPQNNNYILYNNIISMVEVSRGRDHPALPSVCPDASCRAPDAFGRKLR